MKEPHALFDWYGGVASATFSGNRCYRYRLTRELSTLIPTRTVAFVGLNPSTADAFKLDPTCRREVTFARDWGFGTYVKVNLHAWRSTDPRGLRGVEDPVGIYNERFVRSAVDAAEIVICAWGSNHLAPAAADLAAWVRSHDKARYLKLNADGQPSHTLYLPKHLQPRAFGR